MNDTSRPNVVTLLVGLGIGALVGILFAPQSGEQTRKLLAQKAGDAQRKAGELRDQATDALDRGRHIVARQMESIATALVAGRQEGHQGKANGPTRTRL